MTSTPSTPASSAPASTSTSSTPRRTGGHTVGHRDNYKRTTLTPDRRLIRLWALNNGHPVTATGRLSPTFLRAYHDAH